ncbi:MAG TPA: hypothetical protein VH082_03920 [Rudaea sp.]|jgi:hypothetical protein|nr:hypothetical protein [Rudaea sp.]
MKALIAVLTGSMLFALQAHACSVSGTAFTPDGKKMSGAVVRLIDLDSPHSAVFTTTDSNATYAFNGASSGQRMRVDLISMPTVVTGSHLPTRSIIGESETFACSNAQTMQDVRADFDD